MKSLDRAVIVSEDLHNVGDLALLIQCAHGLRTLLGIQPLAVRQWKPPPASVMNQIAAADIELVNGKDLMAVMSGAANSLMVIGGGQMARDNATVFSLLGLALSMRWVRLMGGRTAVLGCGLDQIQRKPHRRLWSDILKGAALVAVRDKSSREAALELVDPGVAIALTSDLVFMPSPLHSTLSSGGGEPCVAVAPCVDVSEGRSIKPERLAKLAVQACEVADVRCVYVVAHDARASMDMRIAPDLAAAVQSMRPDLKVEIVGGPVLEDVLKVYASSRLTITNRLHAAIFSLIAERPILIIDDDTPKLTMTADRFGLARVSNDVDCIVQECRDKLRHEVLNGPPASRKQTLEEAKAEAVANFSLLAEALSARSATRRS